MLVKVGLFALTITFSKVDLLVLAGACAAMKNFLGFGAKEAQAKFLALARPAQLRKA